MTNLEKTRAEFALVKARAEVARLEALAAPIPFTRHLQNAIGARFERLDTIDKLLGLHSEPNAGNGGGGYHLAAIYKLEARIAKLETVLNIVATRVEGFDLKDMPKNMGKYWQPVSR